jgi:WD40 repeat protein
MHVALKLPDGSAEWVAFSPSGEQFAVGIFRPEKKIVIYDTATGAERQTFDGLSARVRSLCFGPEGKTLVSGMADSTAIVWKLE